MPVIIKRDSSAVAKIILYVILVVVIVIVVYLLWRYVISPYLRGTLFTAPNVDCTTAPSNPSGLTGFASSNRAFLQWTATSNTDNYIVYMGTLSGFAPELAERTIIVKGNSIAVLNLIPKTYYFKVASSNSCGTSSTSNEIQITITTWPSRFKLCKGDAPVICLLMETAGSDAFVTFECPGSRCDLEYPSLENIKSANANICLTENDTIGPTIEDPVTGETCTVSSTDWIIDLNTGRVTTSGGLCLGADSIAGTQAYNTECASISNPDDTRYSWVVQATNN